MGQDRGPRVACSLFLVLVLLDAFGLLHNLYFGLLLFVAVPAAFIVGLILIPIGARHDARWRQQPGAEPPGWPVLDLRNVRHRRPTAMVIAGRAMLMGYLYRPYNANVFWRGCCTASRE